MIAVHDLGGNGEPLLVCHATGFCGHMYEPFARTLNTRHHVFAVDLRGHGDSPLWPGASLEWPDITADVLDAAHQVRGRIHLLRALNRRRRCTGSRGRRAEPIHVRAPVRINRAARPDPRAGGAERHRNGLPASQVDYVIEGAGQPLPELPNAAPTDADRAVARLIAAEIKDGACLQIGIGAMPNAVCSLLMETGVRNLGIHTEMLTDGSIDLYNAGVATGSERNVHPGKIVCSFRLGSKYLYDTIDNNPDFSCQPVEMTTLPHLIMQNDRLTTIKNTTQMDLQGQASSESSGHRHISGTGGQLQFVRAGYASKGGESFICMSSTYERAGKCRTRIVLDLTPGNDITAPRSDMMYVVTEYGIVNLKGKSVPERATAMTSLAHPDFRDELEREARTNRLIPKSFT